MKTLVIPSIEKDLTLVKTFNVETPSNKDLFFEIHKISDRFIDANYSEEEKLKTRTLDSGYLVVRNNKICDIVVAQELNKDYDTSIETITSTIERCIANTTRTIEKSISDLSMNEKIMSKISDSKRIGILQKENRITKQCLSDAHHITDIEKYL